MIPLDFGSLLVMHRYVQRRAAARAPRQSALAALRASPLHLALMHPLPHPSGAPVAVSKVVAADAGVKHPTPAELAKQNAGKDVSQIQAMLAQAAAKQQAYVIAHPRPASHAQPADISAWLKAGGLSPRAMFPEWGWQLVTKAAIPLASIFGSSTGLEPGDAFATVQLGPNDVVFWYDHAAGAWSYYHHWGQDIGQVLASWASSIAHFVSSAASDLQSVVHTVTSAVNTVLEYVQIAASVVPGLGQVVNEVVSVAEAALDALGGESMLAIALDTAYHAILSAAPGLPALAPFLDPVVSVLKNLVSQSNPGAAGVHTAIAAALKNVPDQPSVANYSPRSIAASLAGWVVSKLGLG